GIITLTIDLNLLFVKHGIRGIANLTYRHLLSHKYIRMEMHRTGNNDSQANLSDYFKTTGKTFFIFSEHLNIVVQKAYGAHPNGGYNHQNDIDILQFSE